MTFFALSPHYQLVKLLLALLLVALSASAADAIDSTRLERTNLLLYHDKQGIVRQGTSRGHWQLRRAEIVEAMQRVMGPLPGKEKRVPLQCTVEEQSDCGRFVRQLLTYCAEPNGRVPAYLLIPKEALEGKLRLPAVLALHPTQAQIGHKTVAGLGDKPRYRYGVELAERGYVVLAPAYPLLANYHPDLKKLGYQSGTMKAIWDNIRGLDLLEELPYVQKGKFGAIGHSLGGHNSIYTAVFEPRLKVIVSSCGFDSYLDYYNGNIKGWTSERYMPKLLDYPLEKIPFDFHEMIGALAPRPFFVNAPKGDANFQWQSVDRVLAAATSVYALYGAQTQVHVEHPDCEHDFPDAIRQQAYLILDQALKAP